MRAVESIVRGPDLVHEVKEKFADAFSSPDTIEARFYRIGGCLVRLRFRGRRLLPIITPALEHLAVRPTLEADLTVDLADGAETKINFSLPHASTTDNETWHSEMENASLLIQSNPGTLNVVHHQERRGFFWVTDSSQLPWYEAGFPLRLIFHLWFRRRSQHLVHAAAVGDSANAVLIVGKGGSGKSTTALACRAAGLEYLGDDYSLVGSAPDACVWSLYRSAKADSDCLKRFPRLAAAQILHRGLDGEKSLLILPEHNRCEARRLRAILWPRVTGQAQTHIRPATAASLLLALAPSTILQTPGAGAADLAALAQIVRAVPTFILEAGTDLPQLSTAVANILQGAAHVPDVPIVSSLRDSLSAVPALKP